MIGIGVGIDYALFIVTRYRQGIFEGRDPRDAVVTSLMTSGRSVLFAGSTVVISLFGLYLIGQAYMIGLATACIAAVLMVLIAALTLLPAMLGFAGNAIDKLHVPRLLQTGGPPPPDGFWYRWSRFVQRRAWVTGTLAVLVLVALALPLVQHAARLHRRRQRPTIAHHPAGLRPPGPGLRARVQRPARRRRRHARPAPTTRHRRPPAAGDRRRTTTASPSSPRPNSTRPTPGRSSSSTRRRRRSRPRPRRWSRPCERRHPAGGQRAPASTRRWAGRRRPASMRPTSSATGSSS